MAWCSSSLLSAFLLASVSLIIAVTGHGSAGSSSSTRRSISAREYNALFGFGDSMSDTGNICISNSTSELDALTLTHPPYGMTYFGRPSCRWSNGRIVIDFIAQALGLPLLAPSKSGSGRDLRRGANMAITGGTALNFSFYEALGVEDPIWDLGSLGTQIRWFELMPSICGTRQECKGFLEKSLFVFGGFGGNDYNIQLLELALTPEQGAESTPKVVDAIAHGVERLVALGAVHVVVPGILPTGCLPLFLSLFAAGSAQAETADAVDEYGCLRRYNNLTEYHNALLRERMRTLQRKHHHASSARIMYADLAGAYYQMVKQPQKAWSEQ